MENQPVRLNKYLSDAGLCSRREADRLIASGCVCVNGMPAQKGMRISRHDTVTLHGKTVKPVHDLIILAYHKPVGVVCTADVREADRVYNHLHFPQKLKYIGRLDKQSEGLLLFTNQGSFADAIAKAGNRHEKEYEVYVDKPITDGFLSQIRQGMDIEIDDKIYQTRPCTVEKIDKNHFRIVLTQGFNRQIRRMCGACGYHVRALKRIRVMNVRLGDLAVDAYRMIEGEEREELIRQTGIRQFH